MSNAFLKQKMINKSEGFRKNLINNSQIFIFSNWKFSYESDKKNNCLKSMLYAELISVYAQ